MSTFKIAFHQKTKAGKMFRFSSMAYKKAALQINAALFAVDN